MTQYGRFTFSPFAGNAAAAPLGISQFGSLANGTPNYSITPATIIALSQWGAGWNSALVGGASPALEDMNAVNFVNSYVGAYLLQQGIPTWDSGTTYYQNGFCSYQGVIYVSLINSNTNNTPTASPGIWQPLITGSSKGENLFRNAGMVIASRGTSGTITAGTPGYTVDGWIVGSTGANVSWAQEASGFADNTYCLFVNGNTGLTDMYVKQRIEANICATIEAGFWVTFQCDFQNGSNSTVTPTLTVKYPTTGPNAFSSTLGTLINAAPLQTVPASGITKLAYTFQMTGDPAISTSNGMEFTLDFGSSYNTSGSGPAITNFDFSVTPQLQAQGIQFYPPQPQIRPVFLETQINARYYVVLRDTVNGPRFAIGGGSGLSFVISLPNVMRVQPTLGYPTSYGGLNVYDGSVHQVTNLAVAAFMGNAISLNATASGASTSAPVFLDGTTTDYLTFSAEL